MNLTEQHNKAKQELINLYKAIEEKLESIKDIASRQDLRRIQDELSRFKHVLENHFDFYNNNDSNGILVSCRIADKY